MDDINSIDDMVIDPEHHRRRRRRVETNPNVVADQEVPAGVLSFFNVKMKPQDVFKQFFDIYNLLVGTLANNYERLRAAKQVVLVDLGEFNLFQFAQSSLHPADTFILGFLEYQAGPDDRMARICEHLPLYNALKASNSVEVCAPAIAQTHSAFVDDAYRSMNDLLDNRTKIIVITKCPGVLQGERVLNQRGRYVMSVSPRTLEGQGRMRFMESLWA